VKSVQVDTIELAVSNLGETGSVEPAFVEAAH
jgi:hypothetical protein